jgi:hypothetical protein
MAAGSGVLGGKVGKIAGGTVGTSVKVGWSGRAVHVTMGGGQWGGTSVGAGGMVQ